MVLKGILAIVNTDSESVSSDFIAECVCSMGNYLLKLFQSIF